MKKIILPLVIVFFFTQDIASACATCFGDPNSKATQGMNFAIITMLTSLEGFWAVLFPLYMYWIEGLKIMLKKSLSRIKKIKAIKGVWIT